MTGTSGQGTGLGGCSSGWGCALLLTLWVALFLALAVASSACAPADNPPDPNTVSQCAELGSDRPEGCEE